MVWCRFVDDLHAADSEGDGEASAITQLVVEAWLGWKLDAAKSVDQAPSTIVLGVEAAARGDQLVFQVPAEKSDKWLCEIDAILAEGKCSPARARSLVGKLSWGASAVFGKGARRATARGVCAGAMTPGGRPYPAPIFHHASQNSWLIGGRFRRALQWWRSFIPQVSRARLSLVPQGSLRAQVPRRVVPLAPGIRQRVTVFSDATGAGNLAWVAETPTGRWWSAADVPSRLRKWVVWRRRRKTQARAHPPRFLKWLSYVAGGHLGALRCHFRVRHHP